MDMVEETKPDRVEEAKPSLIDDAGKAADRLEKANAELRELLNRQEMLAAKEKLSGRTFAGAVPQQPKEETPKEYAARVMRGG